MPSPDISSRIRTCRCCGCTDLRACPGGCSWVLIDIETPTGVCSQCAVELEWSPADLLNVGRDELDFLMLRRRTA